MAKQKNRSRTPAVPTPFEEARDELFQHIMRCGVVESAPEYHSEWFSETMQYMTERFPELSAEQVSELRKLGERFAQPPKKHDNADVSAA
ncbi:MAG TPA: hypothetical protein VGJ18_09670 [Gemmatimonadaceae bacterium]|jgi:hypothetical protein